RGRPAADPPRAHPVGAHDARGGIRHDRRRRRSAHAAAPRRGRRRPRRERPRRRPAARVGRDGGVRVHRAARSAPRHAPTARRRGPLGPRRHPHRRPAGRRPDPRAHPHGRRAARRRRAHPHDPRSPRGRHLLVARHGPRVGRARIRRHRARFRGRDRRRPHLTSPDAEISRIADRIARSDPNRVRSPRFVTHSEGSSMQFLTLIRTELGRLTSSPMKVLALAALMLVPLLYSGLYLWGNDDPYGNLDSVPAALVVQDEGANQNGEDVNYGEQVRDQLVDDGTLDWHVTSEDRAAEGLQSGAYDFFVTLGPDFMRSVTSRAHDDPTKAVVELTTNDANSYLAGTSADTVTDPVRDSLAQEVGEQAAQTLLDNLATIRSGLADAADGASQLHD